MSSRLTKMFFAIGTAHLLLTGQSWAQCSCAAPSCGVPCSPSCACPGYVSGCATYQSGCGTCQGCCKGGRTIDRSRTIIKKNNWAGFGEAPPDGIAVRSIPALTVNTLAMPIAPVAFNNFNQRSVDDLLDEAIERRSRSAARERNSSDTVCNDPCGDIKQLQSDVAQLKKIAEIVAARAEKDNEWASRIEARLNKLDPAGAPPVPTP